MLSDLKCTRIDRNSPSLPIKEIEKLLNEIPGWQLINGVIERLFEFKNFQDAIQFVNRVADLATSEDHHPDITINYNKVKLELSTHKIGGLSMNDFILAAKINLLSTIE